MKVKIRFGFTLVELMVVLAIVGILASIAVPAYKNYVLSARFSTVIPVVDSLMDQSIEFATANGRFANAYDLGMEANEPAYPNYASWVDNPASLGQMFGGNALNVFPNGIIFGEGVYFYFAGQICGQYGNIVGSLDPIQLGLASNDDPWFQCFYWYVNGVNNKACFYSVTRNGTQLSGDIVPGWINMYPINTPGHLDLSVLPGYYQATCQN